MTFKRRACVFLSCASFLSTSVTLCNAASIDEPSHQINATYRIYVHGFNTARVQVNYNLTPRAYAVRTDVVADGLLSLILRMKVISHAEGYFTSDWISPASYHSAGETRGAHRQIVLTYQNGTPRVTELSPAEPKREVVSNQALPGAIDTLSAMAMLMHRVSMDGTCNGSANVFDGLRLTRMSVHGPVLADVPTSHGQRYLGKDLRCDFTGQQVAGFIKASPNRAKMGAVYPGSAWFEHFPKVGMLAVRFSFQHPKLGEIIAVLNRYSTS